jgi:probable rRNA maturation factor
MLEVELLGGERLGGKLSEQEVRRLCAASARRLGVHGGHVAVQIVDPATIEALNARHRGRQEPTDVLSFPIDGAEPLAGEAMRELGDIVICPEHTVELRAAVVHGMLHLLGMDHEHDDGEMLALQDELLQAGGS